MPRTVADGILTGLEAFRAGRNQREGQQAQQLQNALALAKLRQSGFDVQREPGFLGIGGRTIISQTPGVRDLDTELKQARLDQLREREAPFSENDLIPLDGGGFLNRRKGTVHGLPSTQINFPFNIGGQERSLGGNKTTQEFSTPEQADASGLPKGTIVLVGGRRYEI